MIRDFEDVNKDWAFFNWDELESIKRKIGEDKFNKIKDDLYEVIKHIYGVGFNEGFIDARHYLYKYIEKTRNMVIDFFKGVMKENKSSKEDIMEFVYNIIKIDIDSISQIINKSMNKF